jgi:hypothetical protein
VGTSYLIRRRLFAIAGRDRVLRTLPRSAGLGPQDRMAVVAFDGPHVDHDVELERPGRSSSALRSRPPAGVQLQRDRPPAGDRDSRLRGRTVGTPRSLGGRLIFSSTTPSA